jgi:hypothetical protein
VGQGNQDLVSCRSDYSYAQRPVALQWEGQRLEVRAVEAEWRAPAGRGFRVTTTDDRRFELVYHESDDEWQITLI